MVQRGEAQEGGEGGERGQVRTLLSSFPEDVSTNFASFFERMSKGGFDLGDLQQGAKGLNHVQPARKASSKTDPDEEASLAQLGSSHFLF
jgi:hypothetical protein